MVVEKLQELLHDKRVALVGPAPYLTKHKIGFYINNFDVVCRINEIHVAKEDEVSCGSKTDVVFHNLNSAEGISDFEKDMKTYPDVAANLRMVVCSQISTDDAGVNIVDNFKNFKEVHNYEVPFVHVGDSVFTYLQSRLGGARPTTGMISISTIIDSQPKELFIAGVTFYEEGDHSSKAYRKSLSNPELRTRHDFTGGNSFHSQAPAKEYFKELLRKHTDMIQIDSHLSNILSVERFNTYQLT